MSIFTTTSDRQVSAGLALLRGVVGIVFIAHGAQKLFVYGLGGVAGAFGQMGIPLAGIAGPGVAFLEFFGGMLLVAGLLTRPVGALLAVTMLVATLLVHLPAGFFLPDGYEFSLTLLAATAALTLTGGGAYSVDARLSRSRETTAPAVSTPEPVVRRRSAA
jgi:putative oxidoreductase